MKKIITKSFSVILTSLRGRIRSPIRVPSDVMKHRVPSDVMKHEILRKAQDDRSGFTLLEMVVAMGIFSMFMIIIVGLFSRFITTQQRDIAQQALQEDLYVALETFNREVRTGYGTTFATSDGSQVFFHNQNGDCVQYAFRNKALQRSQASSASDNCQGADFSSDSFVPLTSSDTVIKETESRFDPVGATIGATDGSNHQGFITVIITATSSRAALRPLQLQTTSTSAQVIPYAL